MEAGWRSLGVVESTSESVDEIERLEIGTAVWKIVYRLEGRRLAYIGETDNRLHDRVREATLKATNRNWEEFFRCALARMAGSAELFLRHEGLEKAERQDKIGPLIEEEEAGGTVIINARGRPSWPDWLWAIHATSIMQAMDDHRRRGQLTEADERQFRTLAIKLQTLPPIHLSMRNDDALDDLDQAMPLRAPVAGTRFQRDARVRNAVIKRARGRCELCGAEGFLCPGGSRYIECHHIIRLADQGADTVDNVIALCSEHHREAHFGERADRLEEDMKRKLLELSG